MIRDILTQAVQNAFTRVLGVGVDFVLEHPSDVSHGDYATNVALVAGKKSGENPQELARMLAEELSKNLPKEVARVQVAGLGFINFYLTDDFFLEVIKTVVGSGNSWGRNTILQGKKVMVEYSQPNPFKPFHIGHLMSTTIGEAMSRLVEFSGATVYRANYQGDIGLHVAKGIWGLQKKQLDAGSINDLGEAYAFGTHSYEDNSIAKEEIDVMNKKLYAGDTSLKRVYDAGRRTSLDHFAEIYRMLGTKFDRLFFESECAPVGAKVVADGVSRGFFEKSDGAIVYRGEKHHLHTRVFITSQGLPTYETKELGLVELKRKEFPFDLNITTVAVEQDGYFQVVEKAIDELWPELLGKYTHVVFGMMQLSTGKMSSRKGNVITGESLLLEVREKAEEKIGDRDLGNAKGSIANAIAVAAIKYSILKQAAGKNIIFNPEQSLSFEGDSGPYLQYSHVRALSVLKKAEAEGVSANVSRSPETPLLLSKLLYRFPEVVEKAEIEREPHYVTTYLTELAAAFNGWYAHEKIVDSEDSLSPFRVALTKAFAITMKNGLWLLGIEAPERM